MKIFLDTMVIFGFISENDLFHRDSSELFELIQAEKFEAFVSVQSLVELLYALPKYNKNNEYVLQTIQALKEIENLTMLDLNSKIVESSVSLAEKFRLKPSDSIILATALEHNFEEIVSEDKDFDKANEMIERKSIKEILKGAKLKT